MKIIEVKEREALKKLFIMNKIIGLKHRLDPIIIRKSKFLTKFNDDFTVLVVAKNMRSKNVLSKFIDKDKDDYDYGFQLQQSFDEPIDNKFRVKVDVERISRSIDVLRCISDDIVVVGSTDVPLRLENEDFIIFIAPKVKNWGDGE